jgi:N-acetylmuramoyl-L-alanine amidase
VTVTGWALDNSSAVGTPIGSVQVKVDGNVVGNATYGIARPDVCGAIPGRPGCPNVGFSYALNTASLSGTHTITACATDTDAAPDVGCNSVTVTVSLGPPAVWIDSPVPGATVTGTVTVTGWALDNLTAAGTPISSVQVKVDGNVVGNATYGTPRADVCSAVPGRPGCPNVGFTYALNTTSLAAGSHTITACATDTDGTPDTNCSNSVTVTVSIGPPTVWIDTPVQGQVVSGTVTISGWALDNATAVGTALSSVQVTVDGTIVVNATYGLPRPDVCSALQGRPGCPNVGFSYALNTASLAPGTHTIVVTATDTDGAPDVGSKSVTVTK